MGTVYANPAGKNLYDFWGDKLAKLIQQKLILSKSDTIVNLASKEYSKAAQLKKLDTEVITPTFKDEKDYTRQFLTLFATVRRLPANV